MYEIPTYDHSKPEIQEDTSPSFAHRAAQISAWTPIIAGLFCKGVSSALDGNHGHWVAIVCLVTTGVATLMFVVGIVLGIVALCGMREHGQEGILWRATRGIVLSSLLLWLLGAGFVHGFQMAMKDRKLAADLVLASQEVHDQQRKEFAKNQEITVESAQPGLDKVKTALDNASANGSPDTALAAKATKSYLEKMQALMIDYGAKSKLLISSHVLSMKDVAQKEQLQPKRKLVEDFLAANERLMVFITKAESGYRDELTKFKVPAAMAQAALKGYRAKAADRNFTMVKIRETDQRIGAAMLGMLDVLDANWGGWRYDAEKQKTIFSNTDALDKYNDYSREIQTAASEQKQLQAQLLNMPELAANK